MGVDSGGNANRPTSPVPVEGQTARAAEVNVPVDDIYNILNMLVFLDGRKSLRGNIPMNGYKASNAANGTAPQDYVTLAQVQSMIGIFPGFMQVDTVTSAAAPAGWLYANGQEVSRTTYAALWTRVQAGNNLAATQVGKTHGQYGPGNGTTTFTLPNVYADDGYFIRPMSSGRLIGSVQTDEIKAHTHTGTTTPEAHSHQYSDVFVANLGGGFGGGSQWGPPTAQPRATNTTILALDFTTNSTGGTETRPKNIAFPVLLKT